MSIKVAINGFGRIGRLFYRQAVDRGGFEIVAVNDLVPEDNLVYLLRHDSTHGRFAHEVDTAGDGFTCGDMKTRCLSERDPAALPWGEMNVDFVLEATGLFTTHEAASKHLAAGHDITEAFRRTVSVFEGSVAIGMSSVDAPDDLLLALRGSGQAIYVGLAEDAFVVASEPYGVVEDADRYLRMDGETPANPDNPNASRGQILRLRGALAGRPEGDR